MIRYTIWLWCEFFSMNSYLIYGPNKRAAYFFPLRRKNHVKKALARLEKAHGPGSYYIARDDL